jgi:hypothetical protein
MWGRNEADGARAAGRFRCDGLVIIFIIPQKNLIDVKFFLTTGFGYERLCTCYGNESLQVDVSTFGSVSRSA